MSVEGVVLAAKGVTKTFGGVRALNNVTLDLYVGECHALIGPNGAGKTTLVNVLSGDLKPSSGRVLFNGSDITSLPAYKRARLGICRTYQLIHLFPELTVIEHFILNLLLLRKSKNEILKLCAEWLKSFQIDEHIKWKKLYELSYGTQRKLELCLALARSPQVLLLDEPTAGLSVGERNELKTLLKQLVTQKNLSLILVEHDVNFAFEVADRVTVMNEGMILAAGKPEEIKADEKVLAVYFGVDSRTKENVG